MKKAQKKFLASSEQVRSKLEYIEVDSHEFEREMTMVYLQLKGEFSPQKTAHRTDDLSISQDLLMPSVKNVDKFDFTAPDVISVECKKTNISEVETDLSFPTVHISSQTILSPKLKGDYSSEIISECGDNSLMNIVSPSVVSVSQATVITPSADESRIRIVIPSASFSLQDECILENDNIVIDKTSRMKIFDSVPLTVNQIDSCKSIIKRCNVIIPERTSCPILEVRLWNQTERDIISGINIEEKNIKETSKNHICLTIAQIPKNFESSFTLSYSTEFTENVRLFSVNCKVEKCGQIVFGIQDFRVSLTDISTNCVGFDIDIWNKSQMTTNIREKTTEGSSTESVCHALAQIPEKIDFSFTMSQLTEIMKNMNLYSVDCKIFQNDSIIPNIQGVKASLTKLNIIELDSDIHLKNSKVVVNIFSFENAHKITQFKFKMKKVSIINMANISIPVINQSILKKYTVTDLRFTLNTPNITNSLDCTTIFQTADTPVIEIPEIGVEDVHLKHVYNILHSVIQVPQQLNTLFMTQKHIASLIPYEMMSKGRIIEVNIKNSFDVALDGIINFSGVVVQSYINFPLIQPEFSLPLRIERIKSINIPSIVFLGNTKTVSVKELNPRKINIPHIVGFSADTVNKFKFEKSTPYVSIPVTTPYKKVSIVFPILRTTIDIYSAFSSFDAIWNEAKDLFGIIRQA